MEILCKDTKKDFNLQTFQKFFHYFFEIKTPPLPIRTYMRKSYPHRNESATRNPQLRVAFLLYFRVAAFLYRAQPYRVYYFFYF